MSARVCLLTGASGLFGTAFMERYADRYRIVAAHHRGPLRFATQDQSFFDPLEPSRPSPVNERAVHSIREDLSSVDGIERVLQEVIRDVGVVDVLINAAAERSWSRLVAPEGLDAAEMLFRVNVLAPLRLSVGLARSVWRADAADNVRNNRNIINLSSTAGLFVYDDLGQALYASSKAALNHLTYHLASEFWDLGIRVNAVAPDTFPGRVSIDEVLEAVVSLDASTETGQIIPLHRGVVRSAARKREVPRRRLARPVKQ